MAEMTDRGQEVETKYASDALQDIGDSQDRVEHQHHVAADRLARKLSARQVQMIAIGGTIGTGLFLGQ